MKLHVFALIIILLVIPNEIINQSVMLAEGHVIKKQKANMSPNTHAIKELNFIETNRNWDILTSRDANQFPLRKLYLQAAKELGNRSILFAGVEIDGKILHKIVQQSANEPFVRVLRETLRRPIDAQDFIFFLDDLILSWKQGLRAKSIWVSPGRARKAGLLLHPDDVFKQKPRIYGIATKQINIDKPKPQLNLLPAKDGDILGPNWTTRFKNPAGELAKYKALTRKNRYGFAKRLQMLMDQLSKQGADTALYTTVRNRKRGYLMWGAFLLSRQKTKKQLEDNLAMLKSLNKKWRLFIKIEWQHPKGWNDTVEEARKMSDTYGVVFATKNGARYSNHYRGTAVDIVAYALPRKLTLHAPNGKRKTFDLSEADHSRDLNLSPKILNWIAKNFYIQKNKSDYPHWDDIKHRRRKKRKKRR